MKQKIKNDKKLKFIFIVFFVLFLYTSKTCPSINAIGTMENAPSTPEETHPPVNLFSRVRSSSDAQGDDHSNSGAQNDNPQGDDDSDQEQNIPIDKLIKKFDELVNVFEEQEKGFEKLKNKLQKKIEEQKEEQNYLQLKKHGNFWKSLMGSKGNEIFKDCLESFEALPEKVRNMDFHDENIKGELDSEVDRIVNEANEQKDFFINQRVQPKIKETSVILQKYDSEIEDFKNKLVSKWRSLKKESEKTKKEVFKNIYDYLKGLSIYSVEQGEFKLEVKFEELVGKIEKSEDLKKIPQQLQTFDKDTVLRHSNSNSGDPNMLPIEKQIDLMVPTNKKIDLAMDISFIPPRIDGHDFESFSEQKVITTLKQQFESMTLPLKRSYFDFLEEAAHKDHEGFISKLRDQFEQSITFFLKKSKKEKIKSLYQSLSDSIDETSLKNTEYGCNLVVELLPSRYEKNNQNIISELSGAGLEYKSSKSTYREDPQIRLNINPDKSYWLKQGYWHLVSLIFCFFVIGTNFLGLKNIILLSFKNIVMCLKLGYYALSIILYGIALISATFLILILSYYVFYGLVRSYVIFYKTKYYDFDTVEDFESMTSKKIIDQLKNRQA